MTYKNCKLVINYAIKKVTNGAMITEEYAVWTVDMANKLDVFLLNNRITETEYNELSTLMAIEGA